jgi:hypothetical protein
MAVVVMTQPNKSATQWLNFACRKELPAVELDIWYHGCDEE